MGFRCCWELLFQHFVVGLDHLVQELSEAVCRHQGVNGAELNAFVVVHFLAPRNREPVPDFLVDPHGNCFGLRVGTYKVALWGDQDATCWCFYSY